MTIDERIEKLAERHEALAQSVELLAQTTAAQFRDVTAAIDKLLIIVSIQNERIKRLEDKSAA